MKKSILLLGVVLAASNSFATLVYYRSTVHFGITATATNTVTVSAHDSYWGNMSEVVTGYHETKVTILGGFSRYTSSGNCSYFTCSDYAAPYADIQGGDADGFGYSIPGSGEVYIDMEFWVGCVPVLIFAGDIKYDSQRKVYYRTTATALNLLTANTISMATVENPLHVEAWLSKSTLAAAKINENSRNITWHCVLYDKQRNPLRDAAGNILVFAVVPEWRRSTEDYEVTP